MTQRTRRILMIAAAAAVAAGLAIAVVVWLRPTSTAERLLDELRATRRKPSAVREWLVEQGIMDPVVHRLPQMIMMDLVAIGKPAVRAGTFEGED